MDYKLPPPSVTSQEQSVEDDAYDKSLSEVFSYVEEHITSRMEDELRRLYYELRMEELNQ